MSTAYYLLCPICQVSTPFMQHRGVWMAGALENLPGFVKAHSWHLESLAIVPEGDDRVMTSERFVGQPAKDHET